MRALRPLLWAQGAATAAAPVPAEAAARVLPGTLRPSPLRLYDRDQDADDLSVQGWGLVFAPDADVPALTAALAPLIEAREREMGRSVWITQLPADPEEARRARERLLLSGPVRDEALPLHLLLIGGPKQLSWELQASLSGTFRVGRLPFDEASLLRLYAERAAAPPTGLRSAGFAVSHDGSAVTENAGELLVEPLRRAAARVLPVLPAQAPADLLGAPAGAIAFTLSHGLGPPDEGWTPAERAARLGALVIDAQTRLAATDLPSRVLPGGFWFLTACFGLGIAERGVFSHWLADLPWGDAAAIAAQSAQAAAGGPMVAALPRAALASRDGPLAILGHVDIAWELAWTDDETGSRPGAFLEALRGLWEGRRAGSAAQAMHLARMTYEYELARETDLDRARPSPRSAEEEVLHREHLGKLWLRRNDLAGYLLLGDPAAHIGAAPAAAVTRAAAPLPAPDLSGAPGVPPVPLDPLERAILAHLLGLGVGDDTLAALGLDTSALAERAQRWLAGGRDALLG